MFIINTWEEYKRYIQKIGGKYEFYSDYYWINWYQQYCYYETNWWTNYFDRIFSATLRNTYKKVNIQFYFWESCPGGMPFPHPNYAFDENRYNQIIDGTRDKYLKEICDYNNVSWKLAGSNKKIEEALIELANKGIIIVDVYPTHGMDLKKEQRKRLFNLFEEYSLTKLKEIIACITNNGINRNKSSVIHCSKEIMDNSFKKKMRKETKQKINEIFEKKRISIKTYKLRTIP